MEQHQILLYASEYIEERIETVKGFLSNHKLNNEQIIKYEKRLERLEEELKEINLMRFSL